MYPRGDDPPVDPPAKGGDPLSPPSRGSDPPVDPPAKGGDPLSPPSQGDEHTPLAPGSPSYRAEASSVPTQLVPGPPAYRAGDDPAPGYIASFEEAMRLALAEAAAAAGEGEVPVGAVLLSPSGDVVARGHNRREADCDPTAHAEVVAIRSAARAAGDWRLDGHTLVVTLEPCTMCAGAIAAARLPGSSSGRQTRGRARWGPCGTCSGIRASRHGRRSLAECSAVKVLT